MRKIKTFILSAVFLLALLAVPAHFKTEAQKTHAPEAVACQGSSAAEDCAIPAISKDIKVSSRLWELFFGKRSDEGRTKEVQMVIPGGDVFGARVKQTAPTVTDPCKVSALKRGDEILSINGITVHSLEDIKAVLAGLDGSDVILCYRRDGRKFECTLHPSESDGGYSLEIEIRDGTAGIGTVTFVDPESGLFGGLGHGICDSETGEVIPISGGSVTGVILGGVRRGESGKPGELTGILTDNNVGTVYENTPSGIFGKLNKFPENATPIPIAERSEVRTGEAKIISTLKNGKKNEYSIEIFDINTENTGTKSFKIRVTDPALLAISGGIVRGMSGSPIIQDGKLVGAVTHVMVANPTEGYGIFIENMLNAAQIPMAKAS